MSRLVLSHDSRQPAPWLILNGSAKMKRHVAACLVGIAALSLGGCILLPVPHEQWLSPRFSGVVVDGATRKPLSGVRVTLSDYRFGKKTIADVTTLSDQSGHYSIVATEHSMWVAIMLGPADPAVDEAHVRLEHPGYTPLDEARRWIVTGRHEFHLNASLRRQAKPNKPPASSALQRQ